MNSHRPILVLGGTGKTGRRVAQRLTHREVPVRIGTRSGGVPFDWEDPGTWRGALDGMSAAYLSYYPDLAAPGAADAIGSFVEVALEAGVRRLVLLSGRGEDEALACEKVVVGTGADWTVLRCAWFNQNFSESYLLDPIRSGTVVLPAGAVGEPFVDADDIAEVAATVLTEDGHAGQVYELTGPRLLTFADAVATVAAATGRRIAYQQISTADFAYALAAEGAPADVVELLRYLFDTVLDGRNAELTNGVRRVLGRPPRDFIDYARATAATGIWNQEEQS